VLLTTHNRESFDLHSIHASARFNSLDQQTQQILCAISQLHTSITGQISQHVREETAGIAATVSQILCRLDTMCESAKEEHVHFRRSLVKRICMRESSDHPELQEINAGIEMLSVSIGAEQKLRICVQKTILNSLEYDEMTTRYENVTEAHPQTFQWAFDAPAEEKSWSDLSDWLKTGDDVYWVSGKAGSGKSTFMKHLIEADNRKSLVGLLGSWAETCTPCLATFFFWNSGTKLQQSREGLLRALLFQVLTQYPSLVPIVFPREWSALYSEAVEGKIDGKYPTLASSKLTWKLTQLKDALRVLSNQAVLPLKSCFIIDGLDEFDDDDSDHEELGNLLKDITGSKHIKICLSSRPLIVFEDLFGACPHLKLQYLTFRDIERYVHDKFHSSSAFLKLASKEPVAAPRLLNEIVGKADGVFVWVRLVVQSLLQGIRNRDDIADLSERLRRLPRELKPLYNRLLMLIEPYERWASQAIQIMRHNRYICNSSSEGLGVNLRAPAITISEFSLAMNEKIPQSSLENMRFENLQLLCEETSTRLTARCAGLLEVPGPSALGPRSRVDYFHRTAKDFLQSSEVWTQLLSETADTEFDPTVALMRSCLWYIKIQIALSAALAQEFIYREVEASDHAVGFMAYALYANWHTPSREHQTALIDQLRGLTEEHDKKGDWFYGLIPRFQGRGSFLEITAVLGLTGYVRDTLKMLPETQRDITATSLLRLGSKHVGTMDQTPWLMLRLISLLLDLGADVTGFHTSLSRIVQGAKQSLGNPQDSEKFQKAKAIQHYWSDFDYDRAKRLCNHIEGFMGSLNTDRDFPNRITKRTAEETGDEEAIAQPLKKRVSRWTEKVRPN